MKKLICSGIGLLLSTLLPCAEASVNFYLHGTGTNANPAVLYLNNSAATGTIAKSKDSAGVNFSGGNLWKEVGTWQNASVDSNSLKAATALQVWLGLKNSDDQGTQFDLRGEIYKNGNLVASGELPCITGLTTNPNAAKNVSLQFNATSESLVVPTDTLVLRVLARIGTNPNGSKCTGPGGSHNNATGLRLYFDSLSRPSVISFLPAGAVPTGSMNEGRLEFTGTVLNDGRVLVAGGGTPGYPIALSTAEIYDPISGTWRYTHYPMNVPRRIATATRLLDGRVLIVGGIGTSPGPGDPSPISADIFDPFTETFTPTGPMVQGYAAHQAVLLMNGQVLIAGLGSVDNHSAIYNPTTNTWTAAAPLPIGLIRHAAVRLSDGTVLLTGGHSGGQSAAAYCYDPSTDTWRTMAPLLVPRSNHTMNLLPDGKVLIVGGSSQSNNSAEIYDPLAGANGQSIFADPLADDRAIGTQTSVQLPSGDVVIGGGQTSDPGPNPFLASIQTFRFSTHTWTAVQVMTTARAEHIAALLPNGTILFAGGWGNGGVLLQSAELWEP